MIQVLLVRGISLSVLHSLQYRHPAHLRIWRPHDLAAIGLNCSITFCRRTLTTFCLLKSTPVLDLTVEIWDRILPPAELLFGLPAIQTQLFRQWRTTILRVATVVRIH